ncbi:hypothetical protein DYBT9275_01398 [Dyadobacter sp. CECT 9275]|uniref:YdhG-like domain-containing protein n=1 Tax=Dyadobacter helix TaxID=2822344 RepID=A0A916JBZ8_9BACT|nr:DUF1801 domain-containing protein [Dyadobacter sp. CECT 9275]CAG4994465.1 hypothetical protein DYBT9275_01398 [Dyadobacter sp. CECT 9275]
MAQNKTTETPESVTDFLSSITDEAKRNDSFRLMEIMKSATGYEASMWGTAIVGFGRYHYKYATGHEGDAPLVGFSPRKDAMSLYLASDFPGKEELLEKLGKHKAGKGCIYIKKLTDIDLNILNQMITASANQMKQLYPN